MLKYAFLGTGRCGTRSMARLMEACGYTCAHDLGQNIWGEFDAYSGWRTPPEAEKIIHIIRHPLAVIRSRYLRPFAPVNEQWVSDKYPDLPAKGTLEREMQYYLRVNSEIESMTPASRMRIEDAVDAPITLGLTLRDVWTANPMEHWHVNRNQSGPWHWEKLPDGLVKEKLQDMANRYGYVDEVVE